MLPTTIEGESNLRFVTPKSTLMANRYSVFEKLFADFYFLSTSSAFIGKTYNFFDQNAENIDCYTIVETCFIY